jgi:predicted  nucleic acid-binding Zn-ribbon protein
MRDVIEKLLILQDRDRKIVRVQTELANIGPEQDSFQNRLEGSQDALEAAKLKSKQIETERKRLELEVEAKKQQIEKYSIQQFQTKKNEEYRALAHEIEGCKAGIVGLEDQQLELMEKADEVQKEVAAATLAAQEAKKVVDGQLAQLAARELTLKKQLSELESNHDQLKSAVDESVLVRYQRLRKQKGETTVVGIEHSVCGGCHMKLPTQIVVSCQGQQELISCPNCGRILYWARHMDLAVTE